ncbi:hypothetical protein [Streptomyces sp. NPDC003435]
MVRVLLDGEPSLMAGGNEDLTVTLAGRQLPLGPAWLFHPQVSADVSEARRALTALDAGRGDGEHMCLRPADGEYFRLVLQRSTGGMDRLPVPLGLPGLIEPPMTLEHARRHVPVRQGCDIFVIRSVGGTSLH